MMGEVRERKARASTGSDRSSGLRRQLPSPDAGRPLDSSIRAGMEAKFSHDFANVRVHDSPRAAESARAMNARAFTVGNDVFFGEGQYKAGAPEGRILIAHELTHVVQQSAGMRALDSSAQTSSSSEREAAQVERALIHNESLPSVSQMGVAVMRAEGPRPKGGLQGPADDYKAKVIGKIKALIASKYKGDLKAAFDHYAKNGAIDHAGVVQVLKDADVSGIPFVANRDDIADKIITEFDTNKNGKIEWEEFKARM